MYPFQAHLPSTEVADRPLDPDTVDLGNLLIAHSNDVKVEDLHKVAREDCQILLNQLFALERFKVEDVTVVALPPPTQK